MTAIEATLVIGEEIGRGHFGRVHLGRDLLRERLAVKIMERADDETQEEWIARRTGLIEEGNSLHRANHQNVVQVFYLTNDQIGQGIHLTMEYCEGGSLEGPYKQGPIRSDVVRRIGKHACLGLASLHDRGMIHRDIKPGNILLDASGVAKISDFGLVTDDIVEGYAIAAGYRDHLPPEYYSDGVCSIRSDIWALGVTLYRLLHGHGWYSSQLRPRFIVPEGGFAQSLKWLPHVNDGWRRLIRRMLADSTDGRPSDMREVSRILGTIDISAPWDCQHSPLQTSWSRVLRGRNQKVELIQHSERLYSWSAVSESTGPSGRVRRMGGSNHIGRNQAERDLRNFFSDNHA